MSTDKPFKISHYSKHVSSHATLDEALDEIVFLALQSGSDGYVLDSPLPLDFTGDSDD